MAGSEAGHGENKKQRHGFRSLLFPAAGARAAADQVLSVACQQPHHGRARPAHPTSLLSSWMAGSEAGHGENKKQRHGFRSLLIPAAGARAAADQGRSLPTHSPWAGSTRPSNVFVSSWMAGSEAADL